MTKPKRTEYLQIRLSDAERKMFEKSALENGRTLCGDLRFRALRDYRREIEQKAQHDTTLTS